MKKQYYIKKDICVATSFPTDLGGSVIKWKDHRIEEIQTLFPTPPFTICVALGNYSFCAFS